MGNRYYRPESKERMEDATILNGNPSGIICKNKTPHQWAVKLWNLALANNWFPSECNLVGDRNRYSKLDDKHKKAYDRALSQIMVNDNIQMPQLIEAIANNVTSPMVKLCLTRQSFEEGLHSVTYEDMAIDICEDLDSIQTLELSDKPLARKNKAVTDMYAKLNDNVDEVTLDDRLLGYCANQILEELVFPGSFLTLWSFNFTGTNLAIGFIERDESTFHVPLFRNMFRSVLREKGIKLNKKLVKKMHKLIKHMAEEEKLWMYDLTKDLLGFSEKAVDLFVENKANSICDNLKLDYLYEKTDGGPLEKMYRRYSKASKDGKAAIDSKTNFFETAVVDYAKGVIDENY